MGFRLWRLLRLEGGGAVSGRPKWRDPIGIAGAGAFGVRVDRQVQEGYISCSC